MSILASKNRSSNQNIEASYEEILEPLLQGLRIRNHDIPRTIVYTKLRWCGFGHNSAYELLGPDMYISPGDLSTSFVAHFHAPQAPKIKVKKLSNQVKVSPKMKSNKNTTS